MDPILREKREKQGKELLELRGILVQRRDEGLEDAVRLQVQESMHCLEAFVSWGLTEEGVNLVMKCLSISKHKLCTVLKNNLCLQNYRLANEKEVLQFNSSSWQEVYDKVTPSNPNPDHTSVIKVSHEETDT